MRKFSISFNSNVFMLVCLIVSLMEHDAYATTYYGNGGNWSQTTSWWSTPTGGTVNTIPSALDIVVILGNRVQNVDIATAECASLQIGQSTNENAQLTVLQAQKLKVWGDVLIKSPSDPPHRYSTLEVENGSILEIVGNVTLQPSATFNNTHFGRHTPDDTMIILIGGSVDVGRGGVFDVSGSGNNSATIRGAVNIKKNATLNLSGSGNNTVIISGTMTNEGDVNIINTGSGISRLSVTGIVTNDGTFYLSDASIFNYTNTYKGSGEYNGKLFTNPVGRTVASSGCPRFKNGFDNFGTLSIDLNGTTACTLASQLQVNGSATINPGSILTVNFGYIPIIGQTYLLSTGNPTGSFATINVNTSGSSITCRYSLGILTIDAVLSAELTEFTAHTEGGKTNLNWHTASEKNTSHFVIERSSDGLSFETIGKTPALGKSNDYNFMDEAPLQGINYYRLTIVDLDGTVSFSKIISIQLNNKRNKLFVYPNPVGTEGYLNLNIETADNIKNIVLSNALGQTVLTTQETKINMAQFPKGLYYVSVKTGKATMTEKFVKN